MGIRPDFDPEDDTAAGYSYRCTLVTDSAPTRYVHKQGGAFLPILIAQGSRCPYNTV
ncbi:hypothetical protein [Paenarthrobacter nitroguajacolicus]